MRLVLLWWMGFLASSWAPRAVVNEEGVGVGDVLSASVDDWERLY